MMSADKDQAPRRQSAGGNRQGSASGQPGGSGIHSDFAHAAPDSNVNPPGAPQSGAGSIAGNRASEVSGGVAGQLQASRNAQSGKGENAAGDHPSTSAEGPKADDGRSVINSAGGAGMDRDS
jgi:hypothetical protein